MNHLKGKMFLILLLICSSCCFAKQISFQVVQSNNSFDEVTEEAFFVEDALISDFFENGYIVTNSPAAVSDSDDCEKKLWKTGAEEALNGGSDYFVQVILYFTEKKDSTINKNVMILDKIDYTVCVTKSLDIIAESSLACNLRIYESKDLIGISQKLVDEIFEVINA